MRRVVVTGMGIVSPIGNSLPETEYSLRHGISGITPCEEFIEHGFSAQNKGSVKNFEMFEVDKNTRRRLGLGNQLRFPLASTKQALEDAGLTPKEIKSSGVLFGQGGGSTITVHEVAQQTLKKGRPSVPLGCINAVTPTMCSGASAEIATQWLCEAFNLSVSAACATGNFAIGYAARHILMGDAPVVICGSCDSTDWVMSSPFNVIPAMSRNRDYAPAQVSRPFDKGRSGFVMGEGSGTLILEDREHALARGAHIYCELVGFGFSSDGKGEPTDPDVDGASRSMLNALKHFDGTEIDASRVGYIKAHGTSTENGDDNELKAIANTFRDICDVTVPPIGSPKSLTGHALGGAGAIETIFGIQMLTNNFLAPSINIDDPSDVAEELGLDDKLQREGVADTEIDVVLANSFGFGGTNATLALARYDG